MLEDNLQEEIDEESDEEFTDTDESADEGGPQEDLGENELVIGEKGGEKDEKTEEKPVKKEEIDLEKEKLISYEQGKREAFFGTKNKFTGEEMTDDYDVQYYFKQLEMENKGFDPLEPKDYLKYEKALKAEADSQKLRQKKEMDSFMQDVNKFAADNPTIDISELLSDSRFANYAEGKLGNVSFQKIYDGFNKLFTNFEKNAVLKQQNIEAKQKANPGSLSSNAGNDETEFFTMEEMKAMTPAEVKKNFTKIEKSLNRLNK